MISVDMNEPSGLKKEPEWTVFVRLKNSNLRHIIYNLVDQVHFQLSHLHGLKRNDVSIS